MAGIDLRQTAAGKGNCVGSRIDPKTVSACILGLGAECSTRSLGGNGYTTQPFPDVVKSVTVEIINRHTGEEFPITIGEILRHHGRVGIGDPVGMGIRPDDLTDPDFREVAIENVVPVPEVRNSPS